MNSAGERQKRLLHSSSSRGKVSAEFRWRKTECPNCLRAYRVARVYWRFRTEQFIELRQVFGRWKPTVTYLIGANRRPLLCSPLLPSHRELHPKAARCPPPPI